jgi:hypothetical protein
VADNVTVDNGTLTDYVVSADEGVGGQVQRVKLAYSADGSEVHVPADADGLLVNLGTNNDVTVSGVSTAANQSTEIGHLAEIETLLGGIDTKASTIANAVSGTEMQVDVVTMPTVTVQDGGGSLTVDGTVAVTGTFWQATQPVSGTVAVTDNAGSLTVDAPVATPVFVRLSDGSAAITTLPVSLASVPSHAVTNAGTFAVQAAQSGTWNVTNVSGTVSLPTGASTAANQTTIIGHVDGIETLLGTIDADTGTLAATVSGTEVQVDVVAALPAGTNAIGKLAANSGVDIGDVDVTSLVPGTSATSLGKAVDSVAQATDTGVAALFIRDDALSTITPADGDYAPGRVDSTGAQWVAVASGSVTASGSIALTTATTGGVTPSKQIDIDETEDEVKGSAGTVYGWVLTNLATGTRYVKFYNATAANVTVGTTTPTITIAIPAGAGVVMPQGGPGIAFGTAICVAATTGVADNDTGAPGANEVVGTIFYA